MNVRKESNLYNPYKTTSFVTIRNVAKGTKPKRNAKIPTGVSNDGMVTESFCAALLFAKAERAALIQRLSECESF